MVEELKMQEARRLLSSKDELELQALYFGWAVDGGNDHLMRAIETSPLPMINDASVLEKGKDARTQRQNPQSVKIFSQLKDVRDLIQSAKRGAITHFGLMGDADPVARLATR